MCLCLSYNELEPWIKESEPLENRFCHFTDGNIHLCVCVCDDTGGNVHELKAILVTFYWTDSSDEWRSDSNGPFGAEDVESIALTLSIKQSSIDRDTS